MRYNTSYYYFSRTPVKWDKFRPKTPMGSVIEEGDKDFEEEETSADQAEGETIEGGDKANDLDSNDKKENVNSEDESGQVSRNLLKKRQ